MDPEIDGSKQAIVHQDHVSPVGIRSDNVSFWARPDLMLVSLFVGWPTQFGRRTGKVESFFLGVASEDSEFFVEIGRASLKTRNCFTAAS